MFAEKAVFAPATTQLKYLVKVVFNVGTTFSFRQGLLFVLQVNSVALTCLAVYFTFVVLAFKCFVVINQLCCFTTWSKLKRKMQEIIIL